MQYNSIQHLNLKHVRHILYSRVYFCFIDIKNMKRGTWSSSEICYDDGWVNRFCLLMSKKKGINAIKSVRCDLVIVVILLYTSWTPVLEQDMTMYEMRFENEKSVNRAQCSSSKHRTQSCHSFVLLDTNLRYNTLLTMPCRCVKRSEHFLPPLHTA